MSNRPQSGYNDSDSKKMLGDSAASRGEASPRPLRAPRAFRAWAALLAAFAGLTGHAAIALDPAKAITQYGHDVWLVDQGLPQNTVNAILQTRDGYIWLGTEEGLA